MSGSEQRGVEFVLYCVDVLREIYKRNSVVVDLVLAREIFAFLPLPHTRHIPSIWPDKINTESLKHLLMHL